MKLNQNQQEAVDYIEGPTLVLAGAGSGKTRVITTKIVSLIKKHNFLPETICALTFTNKAATEMRERVTAEIGADVAKRLTVCTFHSLGLTILRKEHLYFGLGTNFSLFDQFDTFKIVRDIIRDHHPLLTVDSNEKNVTLEALEKISLWKGQLLAPEDLNQTTAHAQIYQRYQAFLKACNAVDFEDLIFMPSLLLKTDLDARKRWNQCFKYVLVDEYQDTNETQYKLLCMLTEIYKRFTVVGDDDQSIYSWRGARPENIKTLSIDFKNLKVIKLQENYRSTPNILNCANALIAHNPHLYSKHLYSYQHDEGSPIRIISLEDENAESERVASEILGNQYLTKRKWSDYAVLYRSNFQSRSLEKAFHESRIPCVITGGTSFFEQSEIKDLLAWFRLLCNPHDDAALLRIINVPRRGIGEVTIATLTKAAKLTGKSIFHSALNPAVTRDLQPRQQSALGDFMRVFIRLQSKINVDKGLWLTEHILEELQYENYLRCNSESRAAIEAKIKNVKQLLSWVQRLIVGKRNEEGLSFIEAIDRLGLREMLDRQDDTSNNDAVQLMTLHAAKGLEFLMVILVGMEEGILPHKSSFDLPYGIEEERRLAYVGLTRAREDLIITYCKKRHNKNILEDIKHQGPSRFLEELPEELIDRSNTISKAQEAQKFSSIDTALEDLLKAFS